MNQATARSQAASQTSALLHFPPGDGGGAERDAVNRFQADQTSRLMWAGSKRRRADLANASGAYADTGTLSSADVAAARCGGLAEGLNGFVGGSGSGLAFQQPFGARRLPPPSWSSDGFSLGGGSRGSRGQRGEGVNSVIDESADLDEGTGSALTEAVGFSSVGRPGPPATATGAAATFPGPAQRNGHVPAQRTVALSGPWPLAQPAFEAATAMDELPTEKNPLTRKLSPVRPRGNPPPTSNPCALS
jgi:hypothetical protein